MMSDVVYYAPFSWHGEQYCFILSDMLNLGYITWMISIKELTSYLAVHISLSLKVCYIMEILFFFM